MGISGFMAVAQGHPKVMNGYKYAIFHSSLSDLAEKLILQQRGNLTSEITVCSVLLE